MSSSWEKAVNRSHSTQLVRLGIAAVLAPLAAPVISILLMFGSKFTATDSGLAWVFGFGAAFGYLSLLLGGIPILMLLKRLKRLNLFTLTLAGAIAGVFVFQLSLFVLGLLLESSASYDWLSLAYGALVGAAVACCFGLIAGIENLRGEATSA